MREQKTGRQEPEEEIFFLLGRKDFQYPRVFTSLLFVDCPTYLSIHLFGWSLQVHPMNDFLHT